MAEINARYVIQFSDDAVADCFLQLIDLAEKDGFAAMSFCEDHFPDCNFLQGENYSIAVSHSNGLLIQGDISSGTLSFDDYLFNKFLSQPCIENAVVEYFFDQTGDKETFSVHKTKPVSSGQVYKYLAAADSAIGLGLAVAKGNSRAVEKLLSEGADANVCFNGAPLICIAADAANTKVLRSLLEHGAAPDAIDLSTELYIDKTKRSALHYACLSENPDAVQLLLKHGAAPDVPDAMGNTPLFAAISLVQNKLIAELLLEAGANINAQNHDGLTPLMLLAEMLVDEDETQDYIDWLLKQDVNFNLECHRGGNLRWYAGANNMFAASLDALDFTALKAPNDAYCQDTPANLITALVHGDSAAFRALYAAAEGLSKQDLENCAYYCALYNRLDELKILVADNVDTNTSNRNRNPLLVAKDCKNTDIVTFLTQVHAQSIAQEHSEITDVKTLYLAFVQQILEFTKSDGVKNVSSLIALMTDKYKQQFAESEDILISRFQFYGWGYTRECQVERFEHDGPNKVTVVRENLINGWPHVEFKRVGKGWKISDIKNN